MRYFIGIDEEFDVMTSAYENKTALDRMFVTTDDLTKGKFDKAPQQNGMILLSDHAHTMLETRYKEITIDYMLVML